VSANALSSKSSWFRLEIQTSFRHGRGTCHSLRRGERREPEDGKRCKLPMGGAFAAYAMTQALILPGSSAFIKIPPYANNRTTSTYSNGASCVASRRHCRFLGAGSGRSRALTAFLVKQQCCRCVDSLRRAQTAKRSPGVAAIRLATESPEQDPVLDWLRKELNDEQFAAATAPVDAPVLVMAGPGSGKTRVLTYRMVYLIIKELFRARHLLAVTFTNKAADEMRARVIDLLKSRQGTEVESSHSVPTVGTIHSACSRILHRFGAVMGISSKFNIYSESDAKRLLHRILEENGETMIDPKKIALFAALLSEMKQEQFCAEFGYEPSPSRSPAYDARGITAYMVERAKTLLPVYQSELRRLGALDFDDLILEAGRLLRNHPAIRLELQKQWRYIMVDETQDTSQAQYHVIRLLAERKRETEKYFPLFLVGDPDQSIYGWRGADMHAVRRFRDSLPETRVYLLENNYRSTKAIGDLAQYVIQQDRERIHPEKRMRTQLEGEHPVRLVFCRNSKSEAEFVVKQIRELVARHKLSGRDIAIMYRTNVQSRTLEEACIHAGVPYVLVGGLPFYERREVADMLACLKLLLHEGDTASFERVLSFAVSGIGKRTTAALYEWAKHLNCTPIAALRALSNVDADTPIVSKAVPSVPRSLPVHETPAVDENASNGTRGAAELETTPTLTDEQVAMLGVTSRKRKILLKFLEMYERWKRLLRTPVAEMSRRYYVLPLMIKTIFADTQYEEYVRKQALHGPAVNEETSALRVQERLENVVELARAASTAEELCLKRGAQTAGDVLVTFLQEVALVHGANRDENTPKDAFGCVNLMTLHASKGLEFEAVFIVGMTESLLPHKLCRTRESQIAEERRLAYVGLTRAKRHLTITWYPNGSEWLSRFLLDAPDELVSRHCARDLMKGRLDPIPREEYTLRCKQAHAGSKEPVRIGDIDVLGEVKARSRAAESKRARVQANADSKLAAGVFVRHSKYGKGIVVKKLDGTPLVVVRFFEQRGTKAVPGNFLERL